MSTLHELQQAFANHVFGTTDTGHAMPVRANGLTGERRLRVYRNNVFSSLTEALRAIYPVIDRLVGDFFFRHAAYQYIRRHPSRSGNLHDFGDRFADFLAIFPGAKALVYLPDVARLEWAYHQVFHAADATSLDPTRLIEIPPTQHERLTFQLHPASRLLASDYPILRIWEVNQDDYQGDQSVNLDEGAVRLLVIRRDFDITIEPLSDGEFVLLEVLHQSRIFAQACEAALEAQPDIDLSVCLQKHVVNGTLVDFSL